MGAVTKATMHGLARDVFALLPAVFFACNPSASFEVDGSVARMTGNVDRTTPDRVRSLVLDHPEVRTISMIDVPGSSDDFANAEAGRLVRAAGLDTHLPADGAVASGGVDFFCAGVQRTAAPGASFGVHSWSGGGLEGSELPRDDSEHRLYVEYFDEMGISEEFYWFTLEAASARDIHWMTDDELSHYGLLTL